MVFCSESQFRRFVGGQCEMTIKGGYRSREGVRSAKLVEGWGSQATTVYEIEVGQGTTLHIEYAWSLRMIDGVWHRTDAQSFSASLFEGWTINEGTDELTIVRGDSTYRFLAPGHPELLSDEVVQAAPSMASQAV